MGSDGRRMRASFASIASSPGTRSAVHSRWRRAGPGQDHTGGGYVLACSRTFLSYMVLRLTNMTYASDWAGLFGLALSSICCMPTRICFTEMDGFQSSSSLMMLKQTVPEGYTLGWKKLGGNLALGGLLGYESLNSSVTG
eukprot:scaffold283_cov316-Pavlova_lutheri.AAC.27